MMDRSTSNEVARVRVALPKVNSFSSVFCRVPQEAVLRIQKDLTSGARVLVTARKSLQQDLSGLLAGLAGNLAAMQAEGYRALLESCFAAPCRETREPRLACRGGN